MNTYQKFNIRKIFILCLVYLLFAYHLNAQSCKDAFKFCPPSSELFNKQAFAQSYKIKPLQKLQLLQIFNGGISYHINLCKEDFLGNFRVKLLDFATLKVLWDNANDKYTTNISVSFGSTQRIFLEITPQNPENFKGISRCIGVNVWYHRDEGFQDFSESSDPSSEL